MAIRAARPSSGVVYWEKQGANRMCALHCINSLLQGPVYDETEMSKIGYDFDRRERQLMAEGMDPAAYKEFFDEESGNVAHDGFFNVSVLMECLRKQHVQCLSTSKPEVRAVLADPSREEGFILNLNEHWFAIRKVDGTWYNLDSLKPSPVAMTAEQLKSLLTSLTLQGYVAFVARRDVGSLPAPEPQQVRMNQFYLTKREMEELQRQAKEKEAQDAKAASAYGDDGDSKKSFLAWAPRGRREEHSWPSDGGYRLDASGPRREDSRGASPRPSAEATLDGLDDDPELREALRLSLETYKQEMQAPPEEPPADAQNICTIVVRLKNGEKVTRRFRQTDTMEHVFQWAEYETSQRDGTTLGRSCVLVQTVPKRKFCKLGGQICLCEGDTEVRKTRNSQSNNIREQNSVCLY
ncbi:josephin protein [Toxoplasma gondii p89]|uniref:ubiquitinyl hydrolase 1 n=1 Tax=Toxoplasma gondii p89 TaxID=943119 RepID=A0A086L255_TOXGO|nr:josephin protein [Toxoplasma gondii p89]